MQKFKVSELKPHPRNNEFFDDVTGEKWDEFLDSIRRKGVIESVIINQDRVILSGHQRVRACKELGIEEVECEMHYFDNPDDELRELLYTNIRRRGDLGVSLVKLGRIAAEIQRLDGNRQGRPEKNRRSSPISSSAIADMLGASDRHIREAKQLAALPEEWQTLIESGTVAPRVVNDLICRLSEAEQTELLRTLPAAEKLTRSQVSEYIEQIRTKDNMIEGYKRRLERVSELEKAVQAAEAEKANMERQMTAMQEKIDNPPTKVVPPADYEDIKHRLESSNRANADADRLYRIKINELEKAKAELEAERKKVAEMEKAAEEAKKKTTDGQYREDIDSDAVLCVMKCNSFLREIAGYAYISERMSELSPHRAESFKKAINAIGAWATNISSFF